MTSKVTKARWFAVSAHFEQIHGDRLYIFHLDEVEELVRPYGEYPRVVAYLHDVLEDTDTTTDELIAEFGPVITEAIKAVSDEPGRNRRERKERTNYKLSQLEGKTAHLALIVKPADRLANYKYSIQNKQDRLVKMYSKEHPAFRAAAYRKGLCDPLWEELDKLIGNSTSPLTFS